MRLRVASLIPAILLAGAACAETNPTAPLAGPGPSLSQEVVTTPASGPWARIVEGETGPGSLYRLHVPQDWNGDAVYYAHGIRAPFEPITLRDQDQHRAVTDALGAMGYAVAFSSYSENGLAIKDGAQRTHQLRGLLASELGGQPARSFLVGHSLGALVAQNLAERFPGQYDGSLLVCGMLGGTPLELDYVGHVRALFDFYYPGVLPGDVVNVPESAATLTPQQVQALVVPAVLRDPRGMFAIAGTAQTPLAFVPTGNMADWGNPSSVALQTLLGSLINALYYQLVGTGDVVDRVHGHSPFDNSETVYTARTVAGAFPLSPAAISFLVGTAQAGVTRYTSTPDAVNYLTKYYVPTGALEDPTITVHTIFDPLVPFFHEAAFARIVNAAGAQGQLLQRAVPAYGHCNIPAAAVTQSFTDLVGWATSGVKPVN